MKRKITAALLAASALLTTSALAANVTFDANGSEKAVITCYDNDGVLVYAKLVSAENGSFTADIPTEYDGFLKKAYLTGENGSVIRLDETAATPAPSETPDTAATPKPSATAKPIRHDFPAIYQKEVDSIYGMALVKDVMTDVNDNDEIVNAVTLFYNGKEMTVSIKESLTLTSAPDAFKELKGASIQSLKRGDVIMLTANASGDTVRTVDLIFRPTEKDIVTDTADYGDSFERLFTQNGKVAGKWSYMTYTEKPSDDRYNYVFGIVAERAPGSLSLINKNAVEEEMIDLDIRKDTLVYTCDVYGREYDVELSDIYGIETTLPDNMFDRDEPFVLDADNTYNYALARVVDGITTELILFNNYNE